MDVTATAAAGINSRLAITELDVVTFPWVINAQADLDCARAPSCGMHSHFADIIIGSIWHIASHSAEQTTVEGLN